MKLSKERKIEAFIFTLASLILLTSYMNFRSVRVKFHNKTGDNIDSLVIAGTYIGSLKKDQSTEYVNFKEFEFDGDLPYENISGIANNKKLEKLHWSWCGTGRNTKSKGSYIFDIRKAVNDEGNPSLFLVAHNKKIFWEEK